MTDECFLNRYGWTANPLILRYDLIILSSQKMVHHAVKKTGSVIWPENHCSFHLITPFKEEIEDPRVHVTYIDDMNNLPRALTRRTIVIEEDLFLPCGWDSTIKEYLEIDTKHIVVPGLTYSPNTEQKSPLMKRIITDPEMQMDWYNTTAQNVFVEAEYDDVLKPLYAFDRDVVENFNNAPWGILKSVVLGNSTITVREHTEDKFQEIEYNLLDLVY